ncbi:MAG: carbohydrate kinase family protein [Chloroflexota bacterium]
MEPTYILAGKLQRNILLPAFEKPLIDVPGGDLLYAAAGLLIWDNNAGLLARAGEDYPREWLHEFEQYGLDTQGIHIIPEQMDLRNFVSYNEHFDIQQNNPLAQFARLGLPYPRILLGYQPTVETRIGPAKVPVSSPRPSEIPKDYLLSHQVHLCALDYATISRLISTFRENQVSTLTLDPLARWMQPTNWSEVSLILNGLTAFLPSEQELRSLFWGKTTDLVEMAQAIAAQSCEMVVVKCGSQGQLFYDGATHKCWQIPAYPVKLMDPTGAGASFCGGFLSGLHLTNDPLKAVLHGNISASLTIEGSGAFHILQSHIGLAQARLHSLQENIREI